MRLKPGPLRLISRLVLLALPIVGVCELLAHFIASASAPRSQDWAALERPLEALRREGEPIVVTPRWAEPLVRQQLGAARFPLAEVARPDADRFEAVVEISVDGDRAPETADWIAEQQVDAEALTIRRLNNPRPRLPRADFVDLVPRAEVRFGEPARRCTWNPNARVAAGGLGGHPTFPAARFECPGSVFFNVGVTVIADEHFLPRRCIWAHPPAAGDLVLRFSDVDLGEEIVGHGGMYWMVERTRAGAPVRLRVSVDDTPVGEVVHEDGDGWRSFALPLGDRSGREGAEVEFAVSSADFRHRHFCFEAVSR